jgi:hypothetical protein
LPDVSQREIHSRKLGRSWNQVQVGSAFDPSDRLRRPTLMAQDLGDRGPHRDRSHAQRDRGVHVGLEIDQKYRPSRCRERCRDIDGGRGFPDPAFGIEGCADHRRTRLPAAGQLRI